jgi:hypothetical protein
MPKIETDRKNDSKNDTFVLSDDESMLKYTFTYRDTSKRPKSCTYTDWRGQLTRPNTGKKKKL